MAFVCQLCGECCSSMGEVIDIQEKTGDTEFKISYTTTGEERLVTLDPDKRDLFFQNVTKSGMACPFLRQESPGRVICTVHHSRPDLCRQYSCFRILILNAEGKRVGRVMDRTRYLVSSDIPFHAYWQRECQLPEIIDEERWEMEIDKILTREGFHVVR